MAGASVSSLISTQTYPYILTCTNRNTQKYTHRITSHCNYTTWTDPYVVEIFYHGLPTGPVSIGKAAYPAMVLPPFATHALNQTGAFLNVPKELAQQSMAKGGVSPMSIHMVARTRAQAFGASLPRLPANFDMKCTYQNHWGAVPTDTVCDSHLRPIWTR